MGRLDAMEQYIIQNEKVTIHQLQKTFDVSINTLRRDLDELEGRGHVTKVYGGAAACMLPTLIPMSKRFQFNIKQKRMIGELAASVIPDDTSIFIDSGSTTHNVIRSLGDRRRLTLISHSLIALNAASNLKEVNIISLGGIYNTTIGAFVGISTFDAIKTLSVKIAVMAATGVSIQHGLSNTTYFEAEMKQMAVSCCEKIILLADHTKFGRNALISYCPLDRVSTVVTDVQPSKEYMDFFEKHNIEILYSREESAKR